MKKYFLNDVGLNADIARHRAEENELRSRIAELEGKDDYRSGRVLKTYRNLLDILLQSKANLTSKIGRK